MAKELGGAGLRHIRTLFQLGTIGGLSDGQLLEKYTTRSGEAAELAFAALLERHGPMVLRVCRSILRDEHEAHDAFQATFLVLVRRARSLWVRDSLGPWLHQVAFRVASCARSAAARRRRLERKAAERAAQPACDKECDDLDTILHEELGRLPERYRAVIVLCCLEGLSQEQAARSLGLPIGTVQSRLARGRERLGGRLASRGLAPAVGLPGVAIAADRAMAAVPPSLGEATARAAGALAAGTWATAGVVPAATAELVDGALRMMFLNQLKRTALILLALGVIATGAGVLARPDAEDAQAAPPRELQKVSMPKYVVEPPDLIRVEVLEALPGRPISGERLVRPDGTISLGYYGEVYVAGLNLHEIKEKVIAHLHKYLDDDALGLVVPDPDRPGQARKVAPSDSTRVSVDVDSYNSKNYYVQGNVAAPGRFPITGNETVLDAINLAGGLLPTAAKSNVRLVRPPVPGTDRGQVLKVDYQAIVREGDPATNYQLLPGDRLIAYRDPEAEHSPEEPEPSPAPEATELRALERRIEGLERRLDRIIEILEDSQTTPAARRKGSVDPQ